MAQTSPNPQKENLKHLKEIGEDIEFCKNLSLNLVDRKESQNNLMVHTIVEFAKVNKASKSVGSSSPSWPILNQQLSSLVHELSEQDKVNSTIDTDACETFLQLYYLAGLRSALRESMAKDVVENYAKEVKHFVCDIE